MRVGKIDSWFLWSVLALLMVGIVFFYSASAALFLKTSNYPALLFNHLVIGCVGGLISCWLFSKINYLVFKKTATIAYLLALVITALVFTPLGATFNNSTRWLDLYFFTFQPVEILKITTIIFVAFLLVEFNSKLKHLSGILLWLVPLLLGGTLLILQPDRMTVIILAVVLFVMYVAAGSRWYIWVPSVVLLVVMGILMIWQTPYALNRIDGFVNCDSNFQGSCWHTNQSKIALGSGGVWGRGYNQSIQKYGNLPESQSDSIFSVVGEELGFVGCVVVILLFLSLSFSALRIALQAEIFGSLIVLGIILLFIGQALINIFSMTGIIPILGEHLPFISQGGTALFFELTAAGIIMSVSKHKKS